MMDSSLFLALLSLTDSNISRSKPMNFPDLWTSLSTLVASLALFLQQTTADHYQRMAEDL